MRPTAYTLREAVCDVDFEVARSLFEEYAAQLGVDLGFQDFAGELDALQRMYGPPVGCLLLLVKGDTAIGCGAIRRLGDRVCEMKRLYIRRSERGSHLGRRAADYLIERARALGYERMRLDTLKEMTAARGLYRALGFLETAPYYANPLPDTVYLELALTGSGRDEPI